jgi:hypothetical protein
MAALTLVKTIAASIARTTNKTSPVLKNDFFVLLDTMKTPPTTLSFIDPLFSGYQGRIEINVKMMKLSYGIDKINIKGYKEGIKPRREKVRSVTLGKYDRDTSLAGIDD